jgi:glycosyltransferase involved in cell wall biosynthesis
VIPYKGVELLLRAAAAATRQIPLTLDIIGGADPVYLEFCQSLAAELGIADKVTFHARIPRHNLLRFYRECTVFCFPSLSETYGVALLEAMSCGCACVVPDNSGPGEILPEGCGVRVPLREPEQAVADFSSAIIELARRPELRSEYGSAARRHVVAQHDWDRILGSVRPVLAANLFPTSK